jgi:hypothetical protein
MKPVNRRLRQVAGSRTRDYVVGHRDGSARIEAGDPSEHAPRPILAPVWLLSQGSRRDRPSTARHRLMGPVDHACSALGSRSTRASARRSGMAAEALR